MNVWRVKRTPACILTVNQKHTLLKMAINATKTKINVDHFDITTMVAFSLQPLGEAVSSLTVPRHLTVELSSRIGFTMKVHAQLIIALSGLPHITIKMPTSSRSRWYGRPGFCYVVPVCGCVYSWVHNKTHTVHLFAMNCDG